MTRNAKRIAVLRKRMDFLNVRIAGSPDIDLSYDRAEAGALKWAIDLIEAIGSLPLQESTHETHARQPG